MSRRPPSASGVEIRQGNKLPHWTREGATYAVTFRLADSLPEAAATHLNKQRAQLERELSTTAAPTLQQLAQLARLKSDLVEKLLDQAHGACILRQDSCAQIVADALRHFDGERYQLHAWCVMPNHVHVVVQPATGHTLPKLLHSWKSFTAKALGKLLGLTGQIWQSESYDHLIRDEVDLQRCIQYVLDNPLWAGLQDWHWVWPATARLARPRLPVEPASKTMPRPGRPRD